MSDLLQFLAFLLLFVASQLVGSGTALTSRSAAFVAALVSWLFPFGLIWVLTGRGDLPFLLVVAVGALAVMVGDLVMRRLLLGDYPGSVLIRAGSVQYGQLLTGCTMAGSALSVFAYPVVIGIYFFGGGDTAAERIVQVSFGFFVLMELFGSLQWIRWLSDPLAPPAVRTWRLWSRLLGLLPIGLLLSLLLTSLRSGGEGIDFPIIGLVVAALLVLTVVPYVVGWSWGRRRRLRELAERRRLLRVVTDDLPAGLPNGERIVDTLVRRYEQLRADRPVIVRVASLLAAEPELSLAPADEAPALVRSLVRERGWAVLREEDQHAAGLLRRSYGGGYAESVLVPLTLSFLTGQGQFPADEEVSWYRQQADWLRTLRAELMEDHTAGERRTATRVQVMAVQQQIADLEREYLQVESQRAPVAAILASIGIAVYSTGIERLGTWLWNLASGFLR